MNSRQKGAAGEREAAHFITDTWGLPAHRGRQYSGGQDSPDLKHAIDGVHIEVKRVEKLNIHDAITQAMEDCAKNVPTVLHRRNRGEWMLTLPANRLQEFIDKFVEAVMEHHR